VLGVYTFRIVSGVAVAAVTLMFSYGATASIQCETRLAVVGVVVGTAVAMALCILSRALFLIGGGACAVAAHLLLEGLQDVIAGVGPQWNGKSVVYWVGISGSSVVGAAAASFYRSDAVIFATSILGSYGVVLSIRAAVNSDFPPWSTVTAVVAASIGGAWIQRHIVRRSHNQHLRRLRSHRHLGDVGNV